MVSLVTVIVAFAAKVVQEDPDAFEEGMQQITEDADVPESDQEAVESGMKMAGEFMMNLDHTKMTSQGMVGAILSLVILVIVLIKIPSFPAITPAIASLAAIWGAIYCGTVIMIFMVIALIGCVLVLIPSLKESKTSSGRDVKDS